MMSLNGAWLQIVLGFILGIVSTIFAIIVFRVLKKNNVVLKIISSLVLFSLTFAVISLLYLIVLSGGILENWQLLGRPASDYAVKILDVGYVQTKSGNIYRFSCLECPEGDWEKVDAVTIDPDQIRISEDNCPTLPFLPINKQDFVETKSVCISGLARMKLVYAIDNGGRVYLWRLGYLGELSPLIFIIIPVLSGVIGCSIGIIVIFIILLLNFIRKMRNKSITQS